MEKKESKNNKLIIKNEKSSLKINNNSNIRIFNNNPNILSPSKLSINSKLSLAKEVSTEGINIYNNIKNEIFLINQNTKTMHKLKEIKTRNNNNIASQPTIRLPLNNNLQNNAIEYTIKYEKTKNNNYLSNLNYDNRYNFSSDTNREINKNKNDIINVNVDNNKSMKCLFCEKVFTDHEFFKNFNCKHYFCKKCGNNFYTNLLDKYENKKFKCPVFSCLSFYSFEFIKSIVSLNLNHDLKNNNGNRINYFERNNSLKILDSKNYIISNDNYRSKNIIDISNNDNFYKYIKKCLFECPICKDISLYGNINGFYFKCLKCLKNFCKYCKEEYNNSHFDLSYKQHCKVFYRINKNKVEKKINIIIFIKYIFIFIGAFLFIMTFFINKIKDSLKIQNLGKRIIYILLYSVLSLIFTPFSLLLIPYFPIICSI